MNEIKIFPKREQEEYTFRTCRCLHTWSSHETTWYMTDGKCKECLCDKYKQLGRFTWSELRKLQQEKSVKQ